MASLAGKADPAVIRAIEALGNDVAALTAQQRAAQTAAVLSPQAVVRRFAATDRAIQVVQQQVSLLRQQLQALQASTADLTPVPTDTVTSPFGIVGAGSALPTVSLADLSAENAAYAAAHPLDLQNSCVPSGGSWAYLDGLVAALTLVDPRIGFNGKRGDTTNPSGDALSYYHGTLPPIEGSNDVYVIDVISGHCGATPGPAWNDVTTPAAAGAWMSTR